MLLNMSFLIIKLIKAKIPKTSCKTLVSLKNLMGKRTASQNLMGKLFQSSGQLPICPPPGYANDSFIKQTFSIILKKDFSKRCRNIL